MESSNPKPTPPGSKTKSRRATSAEPPSKRRSAAVTIRDVAENSGFSSATVSIVLNNAPLARYIPDTTKARIQKAAQHLGYRPNLFARSLRGRRSHTVGVMVFDMTAVSYTHLDVYKRQVCTPPRSELESAWVTRKWIRCWST